MVRNGAAGRPRLEQVFHMTSCVRPDLVLRLYLLFAASVSNSVRSSYGSTRDSAVDEFIVLDTEEHGQEYVGRV